MAYATGTPTSPTDLLQKLNTFLSANGWTSDASAAEGSGWAAHFHKGSVYAHLRAANADGPWWLSGSPDSGGWGLLLYLSDGYDGGQLWNNQPTNPPFENGTSRPTGVGMSLTAGPFSNYYFFTDSTNDNVVVVVEKTPGVYVFLAWGTSLKKNGTWTGGPYFVGSTQGFYSTLRPGSGGSGAGYTTTGYCPGAFNDLFGGAAGFVRCDVDSFTGKWVCISDITGGNQGYTGKNGSSSVESNQTQTTSIARYANTAFSPSANPLPFQWMQTSALDGRVNLLPVLWWVNRDGGTGFSLIGSLPTIFFSNGVGNGFVPAGEYSIGPDTYKMFPNFAVLKV